MSARERLIAMFRRYLMFARWLSACLVGACLASFSAPAAAEPVQPWAQRIMLVVAHQDDDMMVTVPDLVGAVRERRTLRTVYVTSGDAGFTCNAYTQGREAGVKAEQAHLAGVPNVWRDEERVVRGKRVRFSYLEGTNQSMAFIGLPNPALFSTNPPEGALQKLWLGQINQVSTLPYDGRSGVDSYSREELIEVLRALMAEFEPEDVRVLDASQLQIPIYPFEHVDHMGSAMFATAAFTRYARADALTFYPLYSIQFLPANMPPEVVAKRRELTDVYRPHDAKICSTLFTTICGVLTNCDAIAIYEPFWQRNYPTDTLRGSNVQVRAPSGLCLEAISATEVRLVACNAQRSAQRWSLERGGVVRSSGNGRCLNVSSSARGQVVGLAACQRGFNQQFYVTTQNQLRGPDATCVREDWARGVLDECAPNLFQRNWLIQ
ncbi:MAG TPA: RICIN domain-containing protein [Polyangiales bacterium]